MQSTHKSATNINLIYKLNILCIYSNGKFKKWKFRNQHFILHLNYHIYMFLLINCKQCRKIN